MVEECVSSSEARTKTATCTTLVGCAIISVAFLGGEVSIVNAIKQRAKSLIDELPDEVVENFVNFVQQLQEWEATREILKDEELSAEIERGLRDVKAGRTVEWRKVKRTREHACRS
jgi:predicted transcriptional regulator